MKKVSGSLKLLYSQYRELQSFAQFGSDLDADTKDRLDQGQRIVEVLKQKNNAPMDVAHQICILYAVTRGYLKNIQVSDIPEFQKRLVEFMDSRHFELLDTLRSTGKMEPDTEETLKSAITRVVEDFTAAT